MKYLFYQGLTYKKRGLDEQGNCANFVETEHIIQYQVFQLLNFFLYIFEKTK